MKSKIPIGIIKIVTTFKILLICVIKYDEEAFRSLAERGKELMNKISNDARKVVRAEKRMKEKNLRLNRRHLKKRRLLWRFIS